MAKNFIEKVPFLFKHGLYDIFSDKYAKYYFDYKEVDDKGRYLYWEDFKWRVKKDDDPLIAWYTVKSARTNGRKLLHLQDKNNHFFHYSVPEILQAKLYQIRLINVLYLTRKKFGIIIYLFYNIFDIL